MGSDRRGKQDQGKNYKEGQNRRPNIAPPDTAESFPDQTAFGLRVRSDSRDHTLEYPKAETIHLVTDNLNIHRRILSRQGLGNRRIPDLKTLLRQALAWNRRMNRDRVRIAWKFESQTARSNVWLQNENP